jgi:calcineurin-like phosphoesterase family protein
VRYNEAMRTWFTADHHFGHTNIIAYTDRPYERIAQMDWDLERRWQEVVARDDLVYHVGDFGFGPPEAFAALVRRLHGRKVLVRGNHDRAPARLLAAGFEEVHDNVIVEVDGVRVWLNHYPFEKDHILGRPHRPAPPGPYDLALCGHVHRHWLIEPGFGTVNVGVDVWGFAPCSLAEIRVRTKECKPD